MGKLYRETLKFKKEMSCLNSREFEEAKTSGVRNKCRPKRVVRRIWKNRSSSYESLESRIKMHPCKTNRIICRQIQRGQNCHRTNKMQNSIHEKQADFLVGYCIQNYSPIFYDSRIIMNSMRWEACPFFYGRSDFNRAPWQPK